MAGKTETKHPHVNPSLFRRNWAEARLVSISGNRQAGSCSGANSPHLHRAARLTEEWADSNLNVSGP